MSISLRVLGIDPSLRGTGWAVVEQRSTGPFALGYGTIKIPRELPQANALLQISRGIEETIVTHHPTVCAVESTIYVQSYKTAIVLGAARGAALVAAAGGGLEVVEFAPRRVKQAVTGRGGAAKAQVGFMMRALLGLDHNPDPDAADALAIAVAFLQSRHH